MIDHSSKGSYVLRSINVVHSSVLWLKKLSIIARRVHVCYVPLMPRRVVEEMIDHSSKGAYVLRSIDAVHSSVVWLEK